MSISSAATSQPPAAPANGALANSLRSVVAGIGQFVPQQAELARPEINDVKSQEAFEKFKEYNTNTNLRVSEKLMWGNITERVAGYILTGLAFAIGGAILTSATAAGIPLVISGSLGIAAMVGVSLAVFNSFQQPANREQSDKFMDVGNFNMQRSAALIAQEVKKALREEIAPQTPAPIQAVMQPAANRETPSTQLAAQHEASLEGLAAAASHQRTLH